MGRYIYTQMTNKCTDEDVEYYIKECGDILGVSQHINNPDDPKAILHYIFQEIVKYKSSNLSWSVDSDRGDAISNRAAGNPRVAALDQRSNANSQVGGASAANSAMANSDMQGMPDSDNSYAEL